MQKTRAHVGTSDLSLARCGSRAQNGIGNAQQTRDWRRLVSAGKSPYRPSVGDHSQTSLSACWGAASRSACHRRASIASCGTRTPFVRWVEPTWAEHPVCRRSQRVRSRDAAVPQLETPRSIANEHADAALLSRSWRCRWLTPAYQVAVTVCKSCKRGWQDGAGVVVEVSPAVVDRALCDAQDLGDIDGDHIQRAKQVVPPAVRRTVMRRDHGMCQVPGCRATSNVDLHHIIHREHGGTHSVENLVALCESHHLAAHDGTISLCRVDGKIRIVREGRNDFTRATRAIDTGRVLRERGYSREVVRDAVEKTRAHVGTNDLNLAQWITIAERYRQAAAAA